MRVKVILASFAIAMALLACPVENANAAEATGDEPKAVVTTASSGENSTGGGLTLEVDGPDGIETPDRADEQGQGVTTGSEEVTAGEKDVVPLDPSAPAGDEAEVLEPETDLGTDPDPDPDPDRDPDRDSENQPVADLEDDATIEPDGEDVTTAEDAPTTELPADPDPATQPEQDVPLAVPEGEGAQAAAEPEATSEADPEPQAVEPKVSPAEQDAPATASVSTITTYRLYNPYTGEHFYTQSANERDTLVKVGWKSEGVGWTAVSTSKSPVYRLYNPYVKGGDHHYTMDANERDTLVKAGWRYEGIGWYSDDAKGVPLYRQYNPYAVTGTHNYTSDVLENLNVISAGWRFENIAWYAVDLGPSAPGGNFSGWAEQGGERFYGYGDGTHATGWQTIDGTRYHFDAKGRLSTGLSYIDGTYYSLSSSGASESGWKDYAGYRYYFNSDGSMYKNGWLELDGKTYYLDKTSGAMATGDKWIDGVLRPFASNGVCLKTGYQVSWKGLHLAAENVSLPSYANGSSWSYVHPCTISAGATREQCIEAFIAVAYEYMNAGTPWVDNNCGRPGTTVDCSGLVMEGLYAAGMDLTGVAGGDFNPYSKYYWNHSFANTWRENQTFQPVSRSELERGDLVYWNGHVAIYLGNGQIIESTSVASNVRVRSLYAENLILGYARPFTK